MKKVCLFLLALCLLAGCRGEPPEETPAEPVVCVPSEECFLCTGTWERNNVGIISLNTFEMAEVEVNRYDAAGELIEERAGNITMWWTQSGEDGFHVFVTEDPDRGRTSLTIEPGSDQWADRHKAAEFLCADCMENILPEGGKRKLGFGVIDLATGEIKLFERRLLGFSVGDFYVHCDWEEQGPDLRALIFYSPLRY